MKPVGTVGPRDGRSAVDGNQRSRDMYEVTDCHQEWTQESETQIYLSPSGRRVII